MKISIITINLNNILGLKNTIDSIKKQTYKNIEYIIIDGGSTDGSVGLIKDSINDIAYWISEKDNGIYNAMNKGITQAHGDYILFLNSGDYLYNAVVIETVVAHSNNKDLIYGNIGIYNNGKLIITPSAEKIEFYKRYQHNLPPHPASFIKRTLFEKYGMFNEAYKIIADVAFIGKTLSSQATTYNHLDTLITIFDNSGISSEKSNQKMIYNERKIFLEKEFPQYLVDFEKIYTHNFFKRIVLKIKSLID